MKGGICVVCQNKNPRYKSTFEFYNKATQSVTSTAAPLTLLGSEVTNTGLALDVTTNGINVSYPGTFLLDVGIIFTATTAGLVTLQLYSDGTALPETVTTVTVPVGASLVSVSTIRKLTPTCQNPVNIQVYINTDGTAVGDVTKVAGYAVKLG